MKSLKTLLWTLTFASLGALATGCGDDPCAEAQDKLKECNNENIKFSPDDECSEAAECQAECINNASCEELNSQDLNSPVIACVFQCAAGG